MKGPSIENLVHSRLFPKAGPTDPVTFQDFLTRHIVPEVRNEIQDFYGHILTDEAKYPGLDYSSHVHRRRLERFKWHRRLFRVFDALSLTPAEILRITTWEGTLWAKHKFEAEQGRTIEDTTHLSLPTWDDKLERAIWPPGHGRDIGSVPGEDDMEREGEVVQMPQVEPSPQPEVEDLLAAVEAAESANAQGREQDGNGDDDEEDEEGDEDDEDDEDDAALLSIGEDLNARLREAVARREAGQSVPIMDEDWERWLKMFIDSGLLHDNMSDNDFSQFIDTTITPAGLFSSDVMEAGRQDRWDQIPVYLHRLLRRTLRLERDGQWQPWPLGVPRITPRRSWAQLRLPPHTHGAAPTA